MAKPDDSTPADAPQRVVELAVNLDDATGEQVGSAIRQLLERGALDAWATPITMKKGRPAVMLSALVREADRSALSQTVLELTGSFGVRYRAWDRVTLDRQWHDRPTRLGSVKLKCGVLHGKAITVKPEADDVARLADEAGVSWIEAHRAAQAAADALLAELRGSAEGGAA